MTYEQIDAFLDLFLDGKGEAATRDDMKPLALAVAATYAASAWKTAREKEKAEPPPPKLDKQHEAAVLDVIMARSFPGEDLETSLARIAKAVQTLGFPTITAFSASAAYNAFPHLSEVPYAVRAV